MDHGVRYIRALSEENLPARQFTQAGVFLQKLRPQKNIVENQSVSALIRMLFIQLHGKDIALDQTVRPHIPVSVDMGMNGAPFCNKDNFNEIM